LTQFTAVGDKFSQTTALMTLLTAKRYTNCKPRIHPETKKYTKHAHWQKETLA